MVRFFFNFKLDLSNYILVRVGQSWGDRNIIFKVFFFVSLILIFCYRIIEMNKESSDKNNLIFD